MADDRRDEQAGSERSSPIVDLQRSSSGGGLPATVDPHVVVHRWLGAWLESVQDLIIVALCVVLFLIMARALWDMGRGTVNPRVDVRALLSQVLFVTLLVELYRLLIIYLREHRVAMDAVIEIALVASLREVMLRGVTDLAWERLLAITAFVLALGTLLRYVPLRVAARNDSRHTEMLNLPRARGTVSASAGAPGDRRKTHDMDR